MNNSNMAKLAREQEWSTGLFNCCSFPGGFGNCLYTFCCPWCMYGQNVARMSPEACCGGSCYGACLLRYCMDVACVGLGAIPAASSRGWIRNKYGIPGDCCSDCLASYFCCCCATCQEHRELTIRGVGFGGMSTQQQVAPININIQNTNNNTNNVSSANNISVGAMAAPAPSPTPAFDK